MQERTSQPVVSQLSKIGSVAKNSFLAFPFFLSLFLPIGCTKSSACALEDDESTVEM